MAACSYDGLHSSERKACFLPRLHRELTAQRGQDQARCRLKVLVFTYYLAPFRLGTPAPLILTWRRSAKPFPAEMLMLLIVSPLEAVTVRKLLPFPRVYEKSAAGSGFPNASLGITTMFAVPEAPILPTPAGLKMASVNVPLARAKLISLTAT